MARVLISLSLSNQNEWEAKIKLNPNFSKFVRKTTGVVKALTASGAIIDIYVPEETVITTRLLDKRPGLSPVPAGSNPVAVIEQSPGTTDTYNGGPTELNPLVPHHDTPVQR